MILRFFFQSRIPLLHFYVILKCIKLQKCSNFMFFILAYQRGFKSDITGELICRVVEVVLRSLLMVIDPLCKHLGFGVRGNAVLLVYCPKTKAVSSF